MTDYMLKEIQEQPTFLSAIIDTNTEQIYEKINQIKEKFNFKRIILTGSGDSFCAALTNEYAFANSGVATYALPPMEFSRYKYRLNYLTNKETLLIPISVSGRTPRVVESIKAAKSKGCPVLAITNNPESPVAKLSDSYIYARSSQLEKIKSTFYKGEISSKYVGYEHDVPQTKSYTSVQMSLQLIAKSLEKDPDYSELKQIPDIVKRIIENPLIKELGKEHSKSSRHIFSASGPNYGNALFGEFKMYEFSLPGYSKEIEEYCHTTYFITEKDNPVMFFAPKGESSKRTAEIAPVLKNIIEADSIILAKEEPKYDHSDWIEIPYNGSEEYSVIPYGVVAPLFAYWVAKEKGLNVNTFRGGVEQEKYVEGSYHTIRQSKIKEDY